MGKQHIILRILPDNVITRKVMTKLQIALWNRYAMSEDEVESGEKNVDSKKSVTQKYMHKFAKKGKQIDGMIDKQLESFHVYQNINNSDAIRLDMRFCFFAYGFLPSEYTQFQLEKKDKSERESFISERLRIVFRCHMNDILAAKLFKDKVKTYEKYKMYFKRDAISIEKKSDFAKFEKFVKKHPLFVKKEVFESQGNSVALINMSKIGKNVEDLFSELILRGKHILEEPIKQSEAMAAFNESSVNTIRLVSLNTKSGVRYPYCTLRTGRPGTFVDNGGAGGIMACVDEMTGVVYTDAYDELGGEYSEHPGSGTVFKGYQLPEWDSLLSLCHALAETAPNIRFIGWDFAHTNEGWVVVEGNECCQLIGKQMIEQKGLRKKFEIYMKDMDLEA